METNRKPATPLPWIAAGRTGIAHVLPSETETERSRSYIADCIGPEKVRNENLDYIVHAANAYPKLVDALRVLLSSNDGYGRELVRDRDAAHALLRGLGEAA